MPIGTLEPDTKEGLSLDLFLEELGELGDAKCQLNHELVGLPCSILVTAVGYTSCGHTARMCEIGRLVVASYMNNGGQCLWCDKTAEDCWTVNPA